MFTLPNLAIRMTCLMTRHWCCCCCKKQKGASVWPDWLICERPRGQNAEAVIFTSAVAFSVNLSSLKIGPWNRKKDHQLGQRIQKHRKSLVSSRIKADSIESHFSPILEKKKMAKFISSSLSQFQKVAIIAVQNLIGSYFSCDPVRWPIVMLNIKVQGKLLLA